MIRWWTYIQAGKKYLTGKRAEPDVAASRAAVCAKCHKMQLHRMDDLQGVLRLARFASRAPVAGWCGDPGKEDDGTCGCLVLAEPTEPNGTTLLSVNGHYIEPAGKTFVDAEKCPSGYW